MTTLIIVLGQTLHSEFLSCIYLIQLNCFIFENIEITVKTHKLSQYCEYRMTKFLEFLVE